jgi:hypothetical protein
MSAVILLQEMNLRKKLDPEAAKDEDFDDPEIELPSQPVENQDGLPSLRDQKKDKMAVLAIAYHNMGVEQEFLKSYPAAILSYKKAVNFAEKNLGVDDGITQNLRNVYENARDELDQALHKKSKGMGASMKNMRRPKKQHH